MFDDVVWLPVHDGDARALGLYRRHYSHKRYRSRLRLRQFVGPGERIVLLTPTGDALFVWRRFIDYSGQQGVNCSIFRNESSRLSSDLILSAEPFAEAWWPGERLYTYVNPRRIASTNPGYCFKVAGWKLCGKTKSGLLILEKHPAAE